MKSHSQLRSFFGSQATEVLARYRRIGRLQTSLQTMADEVRELRAKRANWTEQHGEQIETLVNSRDELDRERKGQTKKVAELQRRRDAVAHSIRAVWHRWLVSLKSLLVPGTPSVAHQRETVARLDREIADAQRSHDDTTTRFTKVMRDWQRLAVPLESFDFAIEYLETQQESDSQDLDEQNQAIDLAIRLAAKNNSPSMLQMKLVANYEPLASKMLDLKQTLAEIESLGQNTSNVHVDDEDVEVIVAERVPHPAIVNAIRSGFYHEWPTGGGKVFVEGSGTTHVRKTRSVTEWYSDANGNRRTRTRNEHYWDVTNVEFSGPVRAEFDAEIQRWQATRFFDALKETNDYHFKLGFDRVADRSSSRRGELEGQADDLTHAIRSELERDFSK